jgi:prolyl oligopeptidase
MAPDAGSEWPAGNARMSYPVPATSDQDDDFHGTVIADPYRPLEDSGSPVTKAWVAAQDQLAQRIVAGLPARAAIGARLAEIWRLAL